MVEDLSSTNSGEITGITFVLTFLTALACVTSILIFVLSVLRITESLGGLDLTFSLLFLTVGLAASD